MGLSNAERQARWRARREAEVAALRQVARPQAKSSTDAAAEIARLEAEIARFEVECAELKRNAAEWAVLVRAAEDILDAKGRVIPVDIYKTLRNSAHPDRTTDLKQQKAYQKAFQWLQEHERVLVKQAPPPPPPGMPRTAAELDARRRHAKHQRSARAQRAATTRKAKRTAPRLVT